MKGIGFVNALWIAACMLLSMVTQAQIEDVIVETYYISDANDAMDTTGGLLPEGSRTYRIFIDLKTGSKLTKIFGDAGHALMISGDSVFFNHGAEGESFGNQINMTRFKDNPTVALDTWLTVGLATRNKHAGVLKAEDPDTSILGGLKKSGGFLVNNDTVAGIPLISKDGMVVITTPKSFIGGGDLYFDTYNPDSTIFGSLLTGREFISDDALLQVSGGGVEGATSANHILVAQLTTRGNIAFELNIELEEPDGIGTKVVRYVARLANGEVNGSTLKVSPLLIYPPVCGCKDANYMEYKPDYACHKSEECKTPVVFGCMDPQACNYDPEANAPGDWQSQSILCCYPGKCNDRDISLVCPFLGFEEVQPAMEFEIYPNPVRHMLNIRISLSNANMGNVTYAIYDAIGRLVLEKNETPVGTNYTWQMKMSRRLPAGLYVFRLSAGGQSVTKRFLKN